MGANATTSVPTYVAGQVLEAADLNITNSGVPVFADSSARTAAFGGTGEKVLAEGQYSYLEDTNATEVYDGASWVSVGDSGLVLISTTTIGSAVSSVTVSSAFSATYDSYKIIVSGGTASTVLALGLQLGATTTGYYASLIRYNYSSSADLAFDNNGSNFTRFGSGNTDGLIGVGDVIAPNLAKNTFLLGGTAYNATGNGAGAYHGFLNNTTQYTAFTLVCSTGNITGGTVKVYGYKN
jgi:hypothetical protein